MITKERLIIAGLIALIIILVGFLFRTRGNLNSETITKKVFQESYEASKKREVGYLSQINALERSTAKQKVDHTNTLRELDSLKARRIKARTNAKPVSIRDTVEFLVQDLTYCDSVNLKTEIALAEISQISLEQTETIETFGGLVQELNDRLATYGQNLEVAKDETKQAKKDGNKKGWKGFFIGVGSGILAAVILVLASL